MYEHALLTAVLRGEIRKVAIEKMPYKRYAWRQYGILIIPPSNPKLLKSVVMNDQKFHSFFSSCNSVVES